MKLTVLGKYGPFPAKHGACSGYLLECGGVTLALDLGNGTFSRLISLIPDLHIDAILLSHLHYDHMSDMLILSYALEQFRLRGRKVPTPLTVVSPDTPAEEYRMLVSTGVFDITPAYDGMRIRFGDVSIALCRMIHSVPSFSYDITHDNNRLFYTGDTGWHEDLPEKCKGADVILADTGFLNADKTMQIAPHLTAGEAGRLAKLAGAKQLICTHIWGGGMDNAQLLKEAREFFPDVIIAEEMKPYHI